MPRITDYSFLFQSMFGTSRMNLVNNIQLSQINSIGKMNKKKQTADNILLGWIWESFF